jgi:hypothetical protein
MSRRLTGKRVALLIEEGFAAREVTEPMRVLAEEGANVVPIAPSTKAPYRDKTGTTTVAAEVTAGSARMNDFDAIIVPGGHAPDRMRMRHAMVDLLPAGRRLRSMSPTRVGATSTARSCATAISSRRAKATICPCSSTR